MAFFDDRLVADLLWQPHKSLDGLLEIKNIRVHPNVRLRDFGRFMLKQAEMTRVFLEASAMSAKTSRAFSSSWCDADIRWRQPCRLTTPRETILFW